MVVDLGPVVEGVADVEDPMVTGIDGDGGMAPGVAGERDEHDTGRDIGEFDCTGKSPPWLPFGRVVHHDRGPVGSLGAPVAALLDLGPGVERSLILRGREMHSCVRKVGQATGVVGVEMGEDDVADIAGVVAKGLDLADGRFMLREDRPDEVSNESQASAGCGCVEQSESGVDQGQSAPGLDEQDVAHEASGRAQGRMVPQLRWWTFIRGLPSSQHS